MRTKTAVQKRTRGMVKILIPNKILVQNSPPMPREDQEQG